MANMLVSCPFCGITSPKSSIIELHIQQNHSEEHLLDYTSFEDPNESASKQTASQWNKCARPDCGEYVSAIETDEHEALHVLMEFELQLHKPIDDDRAESGVTSASKSVSRADARESKAASPSVQSTAAFRRESSRRNHSKTNSYRAFAHGERSKRLLQPGRLGMRELGPHAFEKAMPPDIKRRLTQDVLPHYSYRIGNDGKLCRRVTVDNETPGLIRLLSDICALDNRTEATYLCDPAVKHIAKIKCDGNFCGYWNIQMLLSFMMDTKAESLPNMSRLPDVLQIQDTIENAWDNGICSICRTETGGIRNTRKWIGTLEALAYFTQIGVDVQALSFRESGEHAHEKTVISMLDHVEAYFMSGLDTARAHRNSHVTQLAPIYFQRCGHSMTIVGIERKKNGFRNLLVFDPSFPTTDAMQKLLAGRKTTARPESLLAPYRRSDESLTRWREFELVSSQSTTHSAD